MQTALKNPHYKKIWEKVIMNRHPEAKTLEEALKLELQYQECLILSPHHQNCDGTYPYIGYYYTWDYDYDDEDLPIEILGRPITLEDVLPLVQDKTDYYFRYGWFVNVYKDMGDIMEDNIFPWQLTNPLHEQTPETWKQISNLID